MMKLIVLILVILIGNAAAQLGPAFPGPGAGAGGPSIGVPVSLGCAPVVGGSSITLTTLAAIPSGTLVVVGVTATFSAGSPTITGISDGTNTYSQAVTTYENTARIRTDIWYKSNASAVGSSASLVASFSAASAGGNNSNVICAGYVSGVQTSALDKTNGGVISGGSSAYASGPTGTLIQSNEIAWGVLGCSSVCTTYTEGSGFTTLVRSLNNNVNNISGGIAYNIVTASTALNYQPSSAANSFGGALIATFKGN